MRYTYETDLLDEATVIFSGERIEVLALYAILDLEGYSDFVLDEEGDLYLTLDIDYVQGTLTDLEYLCDEVGIDLESDTWEGESYTYPDYEEAYAYHTGSELVWPSELDYVHEVHTVPVFNIQLEMELF